MWELLRAFKAALCQKEHTCSHLCSPLHILRYTSCNGIYFSMIYSGVKLQVEIMTPSITYLHTAVPVPLLVLDPTPLICSLNLFCYSQVSYLCITLPVPICRTGVCSTFRYCLAQPTIVDLDFHCWLHISLCIPAWASTLNHHMKRKESQNEPSTSAIGVILIAPPITCIQAKD
jgi:hypothetical protein